MKNKSVFLLIIFIACCVFFDICHIADTDCLFYEKPLKFFLADYIYLSSCAKGGGWGVFCGYMAVQDNVRFQSDNAGFSLIID